MPGEPATTSTAADHLLPPGVAGRDEPHHVGVLDHRDRRLPDGQPDVGHRDRACQPRAVALDQTGLERAEGHGARGPLIGRPDAAPVSPSTPEGMSTASTGMPAATSGAS